jgi:hypothetical protein
MKRVIKISRKKPLRWFLENYGIGGVCNYEESHMFEVLRAIKTLLYHCGYVELDFIIKFLKKLNENHDLTRTFYEQLDEFIYLDE